MIYSIDYPAGAKYSDLIVREHPEGWGAGFFCNVDGFGPAWSAMRDLLNTGRCPLLRMHAIWDDDHIYRPTDEEIILDRLKRANKLKSEYPHIDIQFSPMCEHPIKGDQLVKLFAKIRARNQGLTLVNNPYKGDYLYYTDIKNECHGTKAPPDRGPFNYSFDGTGAVDVEVQKFKGIYAKSDAFFLWTYQLNGLMNDKDDTDREDRKAYPTSELIDSLIYLHRNPGTIDLPKRYLWKSHCEQTKPIGDLRGNKPVCIIPQKVSRVELVADNGQVVSASSGPYSYADGRWRYYFSQYGYQLAEKASRIQKGNPVVGLRIDNKIVGKLNPGFRAGEFRT